LTYCLILSQTFSVAGPDLPEPFAIEPHDGMTRVRLLSLSEAPTIADAFGEAVSAFAAALEGWSEAVTGIACEDTTDAMRDAGEPPFSYRGYDRNMSGEEIAAQYEDWLAS